MDNLPINRLHNIQIDFVHKLNYRKNDEVSKSIFSIKLNYRKRKMSEYEICINILDIELNDATFIQKQKIPILIL